MLLYLDDDLIKRALVKQLKQAGHDVQLPADVGLSGASDTVHLTYAIATGRVLLSYNYGDFNELHSLIGTARGHHPGILIIRRDNDRRDLKPAGIVRALQKLLTAAHPIPDYVTVPNHYR